MYLGIDIGATKTLLASIKHDGTVLDSVKFKTPKQYLEFKEAIAENIPKIASGAWKMVCVAAPGRIDREKGMIVKLGNLPWENEAITHDLEKITGAKVIMENDAKLATLSEARFLKPRRHKVLYITISTGIGGGLVVDNYLQPDFLDMEPGRTLSERDGKMVQWESFASGRAIVERFGKLASEIEDAHVWKVIAHDIGMGLLDVIAEFQPDIVILGGGVGTHFKKYEAFLKAELKKYEDPLVPIPPIVRAKHPEEAVIYGCYEFIKDHVNTQKKPHARTAR